MSGPVANPQMLTLARDSRAWTQRALAAALSAVAADGVPVSQGYVSKAEAGAVAVTGERLDMFAAALDYPARLLCLDGEVYGLRTACVHHRKKQGLSMAALRQVHAWLNLARVQLHELVTEAGVAPVVNFPHFPLSAVNSPRDAAQTLRAQWGLPDGPVESMVGVLEAAGGLVLSRHGESRGWDAVSQWPAGWPPVFLLNATTPPDRQRFTLAHELGHIVCHRTPAPDQETEAHRFASEFLLPSAQIADELNANLDIETLAVLKQRWKVSMAALVRRAYDLSLITDWRYRSLNVELSALGYRTDEPGELPAEHPTLPATAAAAWTKRAARDSATGHAGTHDAGLAVRALLSPQEYRTIFIQTNHVPSHEPSAQPSGLRLASAAGVGSAGDGIGPATGVA